MTLTAEKKRSLAIAALDVIVDGEVEKYGFYTDKTATTLDLFDRDETGENDYFVGGLDGVSSACAVAIRSAFLGNGEPVSIEWLKNFVENEIYKMIVEAEYQARERN